MNLLRKVLGRRILNYYHFASAILANFIYGFPGRRITVIGVTGTDGKTTVVNFLASIMRAAGFKVSHLSTVNAQIGDKIFDTGIHTTTPGPFALQRMLRAAVRAGSRYLILEVTSHALDQGRIWGVPVDTAVLTNITREHLDYHKTLERYAVAKGKMFEGAKRAVLNIDEQNIRNLTPGVRLRTLFYGLNSAADIYADNLRESLIGTKFTAHTKEGEFEVRLNLPGRFNVVNALAAIAAAQIYAVSGEAVQAGLAAVKGVAGRMEMVSANAMVDFAHTPNALRELLFFLRPHIKGMLILVFGSAGERDAGKRPLMGAAADELADIIILTREDNRSEKAETICEEIAEGIKNKSRDKSYFIIPDRREAIRLGLEKAGLNDLVVITGKGHEQGLNVDGREIPWDDRKVVLEELKNVKFKNQNEK